MLIHKHSLKLLHVFADWQLFGTVLDFTEESLLRLCKRQKMKRTHG